MEIRNLYQPYELELLETGSYPARVYKKTFFEMVFILEGKGIQHINRHQLPYSPKGQNPTAYRKQHVL